MPDQQPTPEAIVAGYLSRCLPPPGCSTGQVLAAERAWNEIVAKLNPKPVAEAKPEAEPEQMP